MLRHIFWVSLFVFTISSVSQAAQFKVFKENDQQRASISNSKKSKVYYEKITWNEKIITIESGYLFLRDRATGEIYELKLIETEPNSSIFSAAIPKGAFNTETVEAEIYSVPKVMYEGKNRLTVV